MLFPISIKTLYGKSINLYVETNDTIESIKIQIQDNEGILPQQQRLLTSDGTKLNDTNTLSDYKIDKETTLNLAMKLGWSRSIKLPQSTAKTICIKTLNGSSFTLNVDPNDTIHNLKQKIKQKQGISVENQRLIFTGQQLLNTMQLSDYNIFDGCTLQIVFKLPSGGSESSDVKFSATMPNDEVKSQYSILSVNKLCGKL